MNVIQTVIPAENHVTISDWNKHSLDWKNSGLKNSRVYLHLKIEKDRWNNNALCRYNRCCRRRHHRFPTSSSSPLFEKSCGKYRTDGAMIWSLLTQGCQKSYVVPSLTYSHNYRSQRSCESYVFTGVCLSTGGVVSQHALQVVSQHALQVSVGWYPSMPCRSPGGSPGPHPEGRLRGLAGGSPGPHPWGKLRGLAWGVCV